MLVRLSGITRNLASLTSQFAADRLSALANQDHVVGDRPEVLFVCVQNAGRSQMAAAILKHLAGDRVHVRTAGSNRVDMVRPTVVAALDEIGVPIAGEYPKPLTDEVVRAADVVVTMGCGDACPVYPGRRYLDWELGDPAGQPLSKVREIRDDIEARVRELIDSL
ncbi:arsenate reductase ArsC [Diaminobutyricibacter sp. McL0608]|uniref:arsenate reductase ArsC n=1 Tax=Leifsonia sp. McL0608 TaxID=3143537 RepID=UPI0031F2FBDF